MSTTTRSTAPSSGAGGPDASPAAPRHDQRRAALWTTTIGLLVATMNSSIVIISLPAIFKGLGLQPLDPGNVSYLLWLLMGYLLVTAVLVVTFGRLGDLVGKVRLFNLGFAIFTAGSVACALVPGGSGGDGALALILLRVAQGVGGAMLTANSTAILTDAYPPDRRGFALGINQVAALAGQFLGLVAGGIVSEVSWRAVFWLSVPFGVFGTVLGYTRLHEVRAAAADRPRTSWRSLDPLGNLTFGVGLTAVLAGITYGIQPYGGHDQGWTNPWVLTGLLGGAALLVAFVLVERAVKDPMFHLELFRNKSFAAGNAAGLLAAVARGGMQFMLIIWLQGIWLPLHGYAFADTPLWAGIYLVPLTLGFLLAGPLSGSLSDRYGARAFATGGLLLVAVTFVGLLFLPADFPYWLFALLIALNGVGSGLFSAPNTTAIMNAVPARQRGAASGMRATFQNAGFVLSIGVFFSLLVAGLSASLPGTLDRGLRANGVAPATAERAAQAPPVGAVFAAFLGFNPVESLVGRSELDRLQPAQRSELTGTQFFPRLISKPFTDGLAVVFTAAAAMSVLAAGASLLRGKRFVHAEAGHGAPQAA